MKKNLSLIHLNDEELKGVKGAAVEGGDCFCLVVMCCCRLLSVINGSGDGDVAYAAGGACAHCEGSAQA